MAKSASVEPGRPSACWGSATIAPPVACRSQNEMASEHVLAYGPTRCARRDLARLADDAELAIYFAHDAETAAKWLQDNTPRLLLVAGTTDDAARITQISRSKNARTMTPIICVESELDDLGFEDVFSWGGDDLVSFANPRALHDRVRALPKTPPSVPIAQRGVAILADPDRTRRLLRARVLRNAGYSVRFALTAKDAIRFSRESTTRVLVVDWDLQGTGEIIKECGLTQKLNLILMCPPKKVHPVAKQLDGLTNIAITDSYSPPENLLFIINELQLGATRRNRASRRLLYGTTVSFRGAGRDADDYGFTFNISAEGMFVRTLAPPVDNSVWLELRPPRTDRRVRLEGEVSWRQPFGTSNNATSPPGFGVRISDATRHSRQLWLSGYEEFGAALGLTSQYISRAS